MMYVYLRTGYDGYYRMVSYPVAVFFGHKRKYCFPFPDSVLIFGFIFIDAMLQLNS